MKPTFAGILLVFHAIVIALFASVTEYDLPGTPAVVNATTGAVITPAVSPAYEFRNYNMFQDVHVMIAIGFGFLMAFLYRNAFTTVGHSFMVMTFVAFWSVLCVGFWHRAITGEGWNEKIQIGLGKLIEADFVSGAVLISFGALVGRCSAEQLLIMAFFECIFFAINEALAVTQYKVADVGGSMIVHAFGAYFGLACSFALETANPARQAIYKKFQQFNGSNKTSDTFAMVGTLFLWCFWPSFNGALSGDMSSVVVVNTYLAIAASCLVTFYVTSFFCKGKFNMVEVQNATMAGGVAVGTCANMMIGPYGAILIGTIAGVLSVVGYQVISPRLPVIDTCGVHNLHGMPAIMAGITSIIVAAMATKEKYTVAPFITPDAVFSRTADEDFDADKLALYQFATLMTTVAISISGGLITGFVLRFIPGLPRFYTDSCEWNELEEDELLDKAVEEKADEDAEMKSVVSSEPLAANSAAETKTPTAQEEDACPTSPQKCE